MKSIAQPSRMASSPLSRWQRLILTGYRGTGKSRIGRALADLYGFDLVDTDQLICARTDRSISGLIADQGWEGFRRLEREVLEQLADRAGLVIATGGGAILHEEAWQRLRKRSIVCWLTAEASTIRARIRNDAGSAAARPPLSGMDPDEEIRVQLARRRSLYRRGSDFPVRTDQKTPAEIVAEIRQRVEAWQVDMGPEAERNR